MSKYYTNDDGEEFKKHSFPTNKDRATLKRINSKKEMAKKMGERRDEAKHFYAKSALESRIYKKRIGGK